MPVNGPQGPKGPQKSHRVTTETKISATGQPYIKKTVHIGLEEQKWMPKEIDTKKYSSLRQVRKLYPNAEQIKTYKQEDGSICYEISNKDDINWSTQITVKDDVKGSHVTITNVQYPFFVTGKYEDGKLVSADKSHIFQDPYAVQ